jgi:hypothetical protein
MHLFAPQAVKDLQGVSFVTVSSVDVQDVSLSATCWMDVQGVSISTVSCVDVQGLSLSTTNSVRTGYNPFDLHQHGRAGCIPFHHALAAVWSAGCTSGNHRQCGSAGYMPPHCQQCGGARCIPGFSPSYSFLGAGTPDCPASKHTGT